MNDDLRVDLQNCVDLLGQNDLEANNLVSKLREVKDLSYSVNTLTEISQKIRAVYDEFLENRTNHDQLLKLLATIETSLDQMINYYDQISSVIPVALKKTNSILANNHQALITISKQIKNNKDETIEQKKQRLFKNLTRINYPMAPDIDETQPLSKNNKKI